MSNVLSPPTKETLAVYTDNVRKAAVIDWYRTPIPSGEFKSLHEKSDFKGFVQTGGYLAILASTLLLADYAEFHSSWWVTLAAIFICGMVWTFLINAVHELGHGTVFKTRIWNQIFVHVFAFLGWINHEMFQNSHTRHHRYTLHPPDDLEVVLPIRLMVRHFILTGFINFGGPCGTLKETARIAVGRFRGEWEATLYPESTPEKRVPPVRWARIQLLGHTLLALGTILTGHLALAALFTVGPFIGNWLFFLCNNTQHIGLQDNVSDFRLCCRTFTLNPFVAFLYWHMNYHTEHHMYAAVPCYNLGKLHRLIRHDLPPCPKGLIAVWKEIATIQSRQEADPTYQHPILLPSHH